MTTCVVCPVYGRDGEDGRPEPRFVEQGWLVCSKCQPRLSGKLREIPEQYAILDATPGSAGSSDQVTGSRDRSLGVRIGVLDLMLTATGETVSDPHGDQAGQQPTVGVLDSWVTDWAGRLGHHRPVPTVPVLCAWLRDRLDWACRYHPAMREFAEEVGELLSALYFATGNTNAQPEHMGAPCPRCDLINLTRAAGDNYIECGGKLGCGQLLKPEEYERWAGLVATDIQPRKAA